MPSWGIRILTRLRERKEMSKPDVSVRAHGPGLMTTADVLAERDSPRDQLVVTLFLLTLFGLLVGAGIKSRMEKAGINVDTRAAWDAARASRRWWEVSLGIVLLFTSHAFLSRQCCPHDRPSST